jgi:hypothetical protein
VFRELQQAFRLYREGKDAEALAAFDRLLRSEPDMVDLWDMRALLACPPLMSSRA